MCDYGLSTKQLAVICALSSGATLTAAAEQAGVHRNTINNWRRNDLPFQDSLSHAQYDRALYFREKMEDLVDLAIESLHQILADPDTPPSVRLKAALAVLQTATSPPEPRKQVLLDIERIRNTTHPAPVTEDQLKPAPEVPNPTQPEPDPKPAPPNVHQADVPPPPAFVYKNVRTIPHNPAQKLGRNELCTCGSGRKYKRCCLNKRPSDRFVQNVASAA